LVTLLGPRQCGKTTLARALAETRKSEYFDLERPADIARLENPELVLKPLRGLVILDEVQRMPGLFPVLRVLADRRPLPARFLLLGSVSPDLVRGISETLAGRVEFIELEGFTPGDVGWEKIRRLWLRGGLPLSYLSRNNEDSYVWRENFIRTFLERDLRNLGSEVSPQTMRRFWNMLAHYHGQRWNGNELAASLGVSAMTTRRYLDLLTGAFMVRQLPPWFENLKKRQVKAPKVYIRDSGLLHALLGVESTADLEGHPKLGASWEGFALGLILRQIRERDAHFWAVHAGPEVDLFVSRGPKRFGFEFKWADAPRISSSMKTALEDLNLHRLYVVYPGTAGYPLEDRIEVVPISELDRVLAESKLTRRGAGGH
jgi:predicted AAA+ superfamily ATPase